MRNNYKSFNHNSLLNLVKNAPIDSNKMDSLLAVLNQRSDRARKDAFNHNCVIVGNPFSWFYYGFDDSSTSVISFPMEKVTTGWRFFLDIEESGNLYISEGKHTNRTPLPTKAISWLSKSNQRAILETLEMLFSESEHFCYDFARIIKEADYLYSYIPLSVVPNHKGLYGTTVYRCYESLGWENHQYGGESNKLVEDSENKDCWYVRFGGASSDPYCQIIHLCDGMTLYRNPENIYQFKTKNDDLFTTFEYDFPQSHWINQIDFGECYGGKSFFIANNKKYEHWSEIPEELRPRIFVEDSQYNLVRCSILDNTPSRIFCFDDIEDIVLNTNLAIQISFKHRHNLPEGWTYDWEYFNKKYPINNVPHKNDEDESDNEDLDALEEALNLQDED